VPTATSTGFEINSNKTESVRPLGSVDISSIKDEVSSFSESFWDEQEALSPNYNKGAGALHEVKHIVFKFSEKRNPNIPPRYFELPIWEEWKERLLPIMDEAVIVFGYKKVFYPRVMLALLAPGTSIQAHTDGGFQRSRPHKIHLPIVTNDQCFFTLMPDEQYHFKEAFAYEINNCRMHRAVNRGKTDRIHLLFECLGLQE